MKTKALLPIFLLASGALFAATNDVDFAFEWNDVLLNYSESEITNGCADVHLRDDDGRLLSEGGSEFYFHAYDVPAVDTAIQPLVEGVGAKYLQFDLDNAATGVLVRTIAPRLDPYADFRRVPVAATNGTYAGFYADAVMKLLPFEEALVPTLAPDDKIAVWVRGDSIAAGAVEDVTNLIVSAGRYIGSFARVERHDYRFPLPDDFDFTASHRLTIRTIDDITLGGNAPGFVVALDEKPLVRTPGEDGDDENIALGFDFKSALTPEARELDEQGVLFPSLTPPAADDSLFVKGVTLGGRGSLSSLSIATNAPAEFIDRTPIFLLAYDAGVTSFTYQVEGVAAAETVANHSGRGGKIEVPLGRAATEATIVVTDVKYRTDGGFTGAGGIWECEDCKIDDETRPGAVCFVWSAEDGFAPSGAVISERTFVGVKGGTDFYEALQAALALDGGIYLEDDAYADYPLVLDILDPDLGYNGETITLDLNGHTLYGIDAEYPVVCNLGGSLVIQDSRGGGAIVADNPKLEAAAADDWTAWAVYSRSFITAGRAGRPGTAYIAYTTILGGRYDGLIVESYADASGFEVPDLREEVPVNSRPALKIGNGSFASTNAVIFYLENNLTNLMAYYEYREGYWARRTEEDAYIWTGLSSAKGNYYNDNDNWRCLKSPIFTKDALAIFPKSTGVWEVVVDERYGTITNRWWLDGEVALKGEISDFGQIEWTDPLGEGRLRGEATLTWPATVPGDLSTLLSPAWAGTVKMTYTASRAKAFSAAECQSWGTERSKVVFYGVNGTFSARGNSSFPFELVLEDNPKISNRCGWLNSGGYTGGIIDFAKLSGTGALYSPKNANAINQVLQFKDADDYEGKLVIGGKRFLFGTDTEKMTAAVAAGSLVLSDMVRFRSGKGTQVTNVVLGSTLEVTGATNDVLMTVVYRAEQKPNISETICFVTNAVTGLLTTNTLVYSDEQPFDVVFTNDSMLAVIDGKLGFARKALKTASLKTTSAVKLGAGITVEGQSIVEGGQVIATVPEYYDLAKSEDGTLALGLNEKALPQTVSVNSEGTGSVVSDEDGKVAAVFEGGQVGLTYGMQSATSLSGEDGWTNPDREDCVTVTEENKNRPLCVNAQVDPTAKTGFFRMCVTDDASVLPSKPVKAKLRSFSAPR